MNDSMQSLQLIRWAARFILALGLIASGAANILHAQPNPISRTISAWPPLALFFALELISRVPLRWREQWGMALGRMLAAGGIAGIAGWVSYWHMVAVTATYGEQGSSAYLYPLTVDGLVVVASITLVELNARIRAYAGTQPEPAAAGLQLPTTQEAGPPPPTNSQRPVTGLIGTVTR